MLKKFIFKQKQFMICLQQMLYIVEIAHFLLTVA